MAFSPFEASEHIKEKYFRYLKTSFQMPEPYQAEFSRLLANDGEFAAGPYLDVTDAFQKGKSIRELIDEGILPASFARIHIPTERALYRHQERSIRQILEKGRNAVVSTGTGSGKTESFLIPVLASLAKECEEGTLSDGVRALLIYPMNALANDQTERLRALLKDYPEITFGSYTGQTKHQYRDALEEYRALNENRDPIPNERISREEMLANPPHIFITNYAMLEYLLIRPKDSVFFEGESATHWKYIVFDEAHVYHGSTGIEVSMLFRRLRTKLNGRPVTYILTSATLGDKDSDEDVAEFAHRLCNADFNGTDVIRADRVVPETEKEPEEIPLSFYEKGARALEEPDPDSAIRAALALGGPDPHEALYDRIVHDRNYWRLRSFLEQPETVSRLAEKMGWTRKQLTDFVAVATKAQKNGGKLFDARYHMFLRATESVFITLAPDNAVLLHRANTRVASDGETYKVFEAATCSYCHSIYLVGKVQDHRLEQYNQTDDLSVKQVFLLDQTVSDTDDDHTLEDEGIASRQMRLCPYCGFLADKHSKECCEHDPASYINVHQALFSGESRTLTKCLHCENVTGTGVLRQFFSGQEASTSVIGTALFEELPSYKITVEASKEDEEDEFGVGSVSREPRKEKTAKQFIAFSDSRQAAAFYASYLDLSYNNILYKRLILETEKTLRQGETLSAPDFADALQNVFDRNGVNGRSGLENGGRYSTKKEAWKAVLAELIDNNGNTSLSRFGLLGIELDVSGSYKGYDISEREFKDLCSVFALSMLADAAVDYGEAPLNENDLEDFTHGGVLSAYTLSDPDTRSRRKAFIPSRAGMSNKRVDYLRRVLRKKGYEITEDDAARFLEKLWDKVLTARACLVKEERNEYRIAANKVLLGRPSEWYVCSKCKRLTSHNIAGVCPSYRCEGDLSKTDPEKLFVDNHYYRLYQDLEIRDLRVVEHTAQLDRDTAYEYQRRFKQKTIDVLSCSTTFEMGVDVGSLETVFMRNMPPLPSNYAQRAGRAGRSNLSAAYALTFCNKSNHDFSFFRDPVRMIKGKIEPPRFTVENDRIAARHIYAVALSHFFRAFPDRFTTVGKFLLPDETGQDGYSHLKAYLHSRPESVRAFIADFLPRGLAERFGVDSFGWLEEMIGDKGVLEEAIQAYRYEVGVLEEEKKRLFEEGKRVDGISQRIKAYSSDDVLSFLSRRNVLPKYGFPVDTVEMTVSVDSRGRGNGLQLQRDLAVAISEYAPGSQIVANNRLITSRYIKKIPGIGWKMYRYIACDACKTLNIKPYVEGDAGDPITECCQCHTPFSASPRIFLIPEQGFAADGNDIRKPGLKKPERTYRGEISYVGFNNPAEEFRCTVGNAEVVVLSSHNDEMAVLNTSPFYVCESCGYTEMDEKSFMSVKRGKKHLRIEGRVCGNRDLRLFSLGYRFLTDVVRIRFADHPIENWEEGLSILYGLLKGIGSYLNVEEGDVSGCLQGVTVNGRFQFIPVFFDNTPGGSGNVKRLRDPAALEGSIRQTLKLMRGCVCGGDEGDSSCYSCLRSYRNQKFHDLLKRKHVIGFISDLL